MLTQGFYYFLGICELAILGLIMAGIYCKAKRILEMYRLPALDQNSEQHVSEFDHAAAIPAELSTRRHVGGIFGQERGDQLKSAPSVSRH
jgi:hypothetical protein